MKYLRVPLWAPSIYWIDKNVFNRTNEGLKFKILKLKSNKIKKNEWPKRKYKTKTHVSKSQKFIVAELFL